MSRIYDNWERLVTATLEKEELRLIALRTPSDVSSALASVPATPFRFSLSSFSLQVADFSFAGLWPWVQDFYSFTYRQILRVTEGLSASNLIKHANSKNLYYGILEDGTRVVVKKVFRKFLIREIEIHGKDSHSKLVPLLGYCLEFANYFLVYKYMSNEDLFSSLFGESVSDDGGRRPSIDWKTRLKIAIGVAESLSYLQNECDPPLFHRNIQASSILLDDNFEVRLGGLSHLCTESELDQIILPNPKQFPKGFEQETHEVMSDVYCFGGVLLELVTSKWGFTVTAADGSLMMDWMRHLLGFIVPNNQKVILNIEIVDPSLLIDTHLVTEIWGVALVAKACLSPKPSNQPQIADVVSALKLIESASLTTCGIDQQTDIDLVSSIDPALITKFLKDSKILGSKKDYPDGQIFDGSNSMILSFSELRNATRYFTIQPVSENGQDERVNKAWLQMTSASGNSGGSLIAVRQYYSQDMEELDMWQSQAEILGRLSHPNLVKFLGHFLMDKKLFLVNEFVQNGSLEKHLFKSSASQPLSFDMRLKILIEAARGLEFLHANNRQSFYEHFDSSDILLDNDYNVKILGFRKATTGCPNALDAVHHHFSNNGRYVFPAARQYVTGFMPMEGDVCCFGVVLFEMLTGLSAKGYRIKGSDAPGFVECFASRLSESGQVENIMDSRLEDRCYVKTAWQLVALAFTCTLPDPKARPSMREVLEQLKHIESAMKQRKLKDETEAVDNLSI